MTLEDVLAWVAGTVGAASAAVVGVVWKKADSALPRPEFNKFAEETRETMRTLFSNAEEDRKLMRRELSRASESRGEIREQLHKNHVDVLQAVHQIKDEVHEAIRRSNG
jgi:hypothetical protein